MSVFFFFSSRRRHTRWTGDWSSDVCSSDLAGDSDGEVMIETDGVNLGASHIVVGAAGSEAIKVPSLRLQAILEQAGATRIRSEERRVGKECRARGGTDH